jgi:hypothetical protein
MNKQTLKLLFASAAALAGTFAQAEPSRLFSQELGEVTKDISVDLDYAGASLGVAAGLRVGAFGGEVLVNTKNALDLADSGFDTAGVGYKTVVAPHLAVYGILSYNKIDNPGPGPNPDATTNMAVGAAYTMRQGKNLILTVNPEFVTDDGGTNGRGDKNTLFVKAGAGYVLPNQKYGKITLIGEVVAENSDFLDTVFNLGVRWEPRRNITLDAVVVNDRGDKGGSRTGIPGVIRLNIAF